MDIMEDVEKLKIVIATMKAVFNLCDSYGKNSKKISFYNDLVVPESIGKYKIPENIKRTFENEIYTGDLGLPPPKRGRGRPRKINA